MKLFHLRIKVAILAIFYSQLIIFSTCITTHSKVNLKIKNELKQDKKVVSTTIEPPKDGQAPPKTINVSPGYQLKLKDPKKPSKQEEEIWNSFFTKKRSERCTGQRVLRYELIKMGIDENGELLSNSPLKGKFGWVKEWGFGQSSYLFDFLDPSLRPLILKDFNDIYKAFKGYPSNDTQVYKDPYNLKKPIPKDIDPISRQQLIEQMLHFNKNLDADVYKLSVNAVQLNFGIKKNKWYIDKGVDDYAKSFIKDFDMNSDGRLNARELILGSIWHNKKILSSDECTLCYADLVDKIDGIFSYIDCDKDGLISSEDIYEHLQYLRRDTSKWNYFSLANQATIRTAVSNDFILKNMSSVRGMLNKPEFRLGVLLGFWDRQTEEHRIVVDDSKNLKKLRWKDDDIVDLMAMNYIKDKLTKEAKEAAKRPVRIDIEMPGKDGDDDQESSGDVSLNSFLN